MKTDNELIAEFMGYTKIRVGYFGTRGRDGETKWQRDNHNWMDKVGMESIGDYLVNVSNDEFIDWDDVAYHISWDWIVPACEKFLAIQDFDVKGNRNPSFAQRCSDLQRSAGTFQISNLYLVLVLSIKWYYNTNKV